MGLFRLLIFGALIYFVYRLLKGALGSQRSVKQKRPDGVIDEMVQDPYCKTYIPRRDSKRRRVAGKEYFFCSLECADKYENEMKG